MRLATSCDLSLNTFIQGANVIRDTGSQEIAAAFAIEPTTGPSITGKKFTVLKDQKQSKGQVQFDQQTVTKQDQEFQSEGLIHTGVAHNHIQANNHTHGLSQADKDMITQSIDHTRSQLYPLFYTRSNGGVDLKMYNNHHQEVDITIDGTRYGKTVSIDRDNALEEQKSPTHHKGMSHQNPGKAA